MREEGFEDGSRAPKSCGSWNPEQYFGHVFCGLFVDDSGEREREGIIVYERSFMKKTIHPSKEKKTLEIVCISKVDFVKVHLTLGLASKTLN